MPFIPSSLPGAIISLIDISDISCGEYPSCSHAELLKSANLPEGSSERNMASLVSSNNALNRSNSEIRCCNSG